MTVSICDILESEFLYFIYFTAIDYFQVGWIIMQPRVFINGFGHENLILIHGLVKLLGVIHFFMISCNFSIRVIDIFLFVDSKHTS